MTRIYVDADACPVKQEVYRVALRYDLKVFVVSDGPLPSSVPGRVETIRVRQGWNAADDWIAQRAGAEDIVITADIPLAHRCLKRGAAVVAPDGRAFTEDSIGDALSRRDLLDHLRQMGLATGGPPPFSPADRRRFLSRLDETVHRVRRRSGRSQENPGR